MKFSITTLIVFGIFEGWSQGFNVRTNELNINLNEQTETSDFPSIRWISPQYETSSSQDNTIIVEALIASTSPLDEVYLEVILPGRQKIRKTFQAEAKEELRISQKVILQEGQNELVIHARNNSKGSVKDSHQLIVGLNAISEAISMNRKDRAIIFATDHYDHWNDLVNPIYDANTIAEILEQEYNFNVEVIEDAMQQEVFSKLADYSQMKYDPQDQLLIFFAGHGYFDETFGEGFVVAKNSLENDRGKTSYISHNRLRSIIDNISCEHILLTMDVCFGGTFDPVIANSRGVKKSNLDSDQEFLARKLSYTTRKYITSGGKTYVSDGVIGKHSPFARELIKALKTGGGDDHILTISEIKPFIEKLVPEPRFGSFGGDHQSSDFVFVMQVK